ncbi:DMT family transporter [uncultured Lactobacillus sp.]|uniref:EamA family transporter n=1 Tax=uncultured Lactobacillus sp. TaxID=153152 RepID=UPI002618CAB6|nr:EamA family transporter [uncultured Lactobacillus sp.]
MENKAKQKLWTILAASAAAMWGVSGLFGEALFGVSNAITPLWLTQTRMIISAVVLLTIAQILGHKPFSTLKNKHDLLVIIAYGLFGLLPVQLFYFIVIQQANASVATILQFMGPFFVIAYLGITHKQVIRRLDIIAAIAAFIGVFLLATHGKFNQLAITPLALLCGFLSAIGEASYTLIPVSIVKRVSSLVLTGWGMLVAGIGLIIIHPNFPPIPNKPQVWLLAGAVIVIGTIIPFQIMANALRYVKPAIVSLLDAFEPLAATFGAVLVFNLSMSVMDWIGTILILVAVLALNISPKNKIKRRKQS